MRRLTILGQHISLIRPERIYKPIVPKSVRKKQDFRCRTIKRSIEELRDLAHSLGYEWSEVER